MEQAGQKWPRRSLTSVSQTSTNLILCLVETCFPDPSGVVNSQTLPSTRSVPPCLLALSPPLELKAPSPEGLGGRGSPSNPGVHIAHQTIRFHDQQLLEEDLRLLPSANILRVQLNRRQSLPLQKLVSGALTLSMYLFTGKTFL